MNLRCEWLLLVDMGVRWAACEPLEWNRQTTRRAARKDPEKSIDVWNVLPKRVCRSSKNCRLRKKMLLVEYELSKIDVPDVS